MASLLAGVGQLSQLAKLWSVDATNTVAMLFSEREPLYAVARPSVCRR